jgi:hypothetical protein
VSDRVCDRNVQDAFSFVEQTVRTGVFDRTQSDNILLTENFLANAALDRRLQASLVLAENLLTDSVLTRTVADAVSLTDQTVRDLILDRLLDETLVFADNLTTAEVEAPVTDFIHWRLYTYHKWALRRRLWRRYMDLDTYPPQ